MLVILQLVVLMWSFIGLFVAIHIHDISTHSINKERTLYWPNKNNKQKAFLIFLTGPGVWVMTVGIMSGLKITELIILGIDKIMNLLK